MKRIASLKGMLVMVVLMSMAGALMACGGDDDDLDSKGGDSQNTTQTATGDFTYFVPYTNWLATPEVIQSNMQGTGLALDTEVSNSTGQIYWSSDYRIEVVYGLDRGKLSLVEVIYNNMYTPQNIQYVLSETEKIYGIKMGEEIKGELGSSGWYGIGVVNGKKCAIIVATDNNKTSMLVTINPNIE